ncbi:MAG: hypothetical protein LBI34_00360 [Puniceicoccales bacterium]|jgi:hypothetical protein|nr:hypothetical protein [Puniceicoccales bacterium]
MKTWKNLHVKMAPAISFRCAFFNDSYLLAMRRNKGFQDILSRTDTPNSRKFPYKIATLYGIYETSSKNLEHLEKDSLPKR